MPKRVDLFGHDNGPDREPEKISKRVSKSSDQKKRSSGSSTSMQVTRTSPWGPPNLPDNPT